MFRTCGITCKDCESLFGNVLRDVPEKSLHYMNKQNLTFQKGEIIFHAGDVSDTFYCVSAGRIQLYRANPIREQSFAVVNKGTLLGHRDMLAEIPHQHSARCLTESVVCKLGKNVLIEVMKNYPSFHAAIIKDLARGWVEAEHQSYNLGARKVMERMADFLLSQKNGGRQEIDFPLTRETVATIIGATTESVIRTLSDFKHRGWIEFHDGKIRLLKEQELERLVTES